MPFQDIKFMEDKVCRNCHRLKEAKETSQPNAMQDVDWILSQEDRGGHSVTIQVRFTVQLRVLFISVDFLLLIIVPWLYKT